MPRFFFFYFLTNSILHGIILPLHDLASAANGNPLIFIWSLILSERDLIVLSVNLMEVSDVILKQVCTDQIIEMTNLDNKIFKFIVKTLFTPAVFYFKISEGFYGLAATWLSKWL